MLSGSPPPRSSSSLPASRLPSSTSASSQLSWFILQPSGWNHSHHRVLMEFTLAVHQLCLAPLDPHPLVHLPDQTRLEGPDHLHGKFNFFTLMRNQAMLPKGIFLLFELQGTLMFFLAVQNSSIGLIVCPLVGPAPLTIRVFTTLQSDPRDL